MKNYFIGGNWKCNPFQAKVDELVSMINEAPAFPNNVDVVIAPTLLHLNEVKRKLTKGDVSAQNLWTQAKSGAYTGEITADLLVDAGIKWTILGHSERRKYNGETSEIVASKVRVALDAGLKVILCIGEQLEDREAGRTMDVVKGQMAPVLSAVKSDEWDRIVLAYEPVWAIGTGKTATPEQAQDIHAQLRTWLSSSIGDAAAKDLRIIYGGSVKPANSCSLIEKADIDGFLVGGASLKSDFLTIIDSARAKL